MIRMNLAGYSIEEEIVWSAPNYSVSSTCGYDVPGSLGAVIPGAQSIGQAVWNCEFVSLIKSTVDRGEFCKTIYP